jgi:peptide/nickel transport system permease protein
LTPVADQAVIDLPWMQLPHRSWRTDALRLARQQPVFVACGLFLLAVTLIALFAGQVATHSPTAQELANNLQAPSNDHYLGTDQLGRDVFSRTIYGGQVSLKVGFGVMVLGGLLAALVGGISGYAGGWLDSTIQRVVDAFLPVPALVLLLTVLSVIEPTLTKLILVVSVWAMIGSSRTIRSAVLSVKSRPYVEAARSVGVHPARIFFLHVMPNVAAVVIIVGTLLFSAAILVEAALSFLGAGVRPPTVTWGGMLGGENRAYLFTQKWMALAPGICLSAVVLAINLFGDGLRDILDPRLKGVR